MHYASHILLCSIALWCTINEGKAARSAVSPDILANFAKNVASVLSPAILGEVQSRNNRSSFHSTLAISTKLKDGLKSRSILDNIVDKTSNAATYYEPRSYPYNGLYEDSSEGLERSEANERFDGSLRGSSYLRQEQPNFYRSYDFSANNDNIDPNRGKPSDNIDSSISRIQDSAGTNLHSSYYGDGFTKAAFPHGPFLDKPYGGFHGFGPYGSHHHYPYGHPSSDEASTEETARVENNGTNRAYGSPYFGDPYPYSPFPYGGYGGYGGNRDFYGPPRNETSSGNGRNRPYGYGPYGGPDFYGPPGYGYGPHGNNNGNGNNNNGNTNQRQTEEPANNGEQNNSTKNGYLPPYGPPWVKPLLGTFHLHGFPSPFNLLPYDHFHGVFKGGPVVGVGPVGYPIYADPYLAGFPFHPYGPFFHGKKYLPPKDKPDSGESTEAPAGLTESENPERLTVLNEQEISPAPSSNRFKTSGRKEPKRINLVNFETRRV